MADYDTETASEIAEIEARIETLKTMRSSGVLMTRHGDTMVQFQTIKELNAAIAEERKDLRRVKGLSRKGLYVIQHTRGL
jgi:hypothetical protein